jgi:hypothetical protein
MKGLVFTAFLELVEQKWGLKMVDLIINDAQDSQDGAYNSINYYPHGQMVSLIMALSARVSLTPSDLMKSYGEYLFSDLQTNNQSLMVGINSTFEMLENIEVLIHTEVRKLYPEANPPKFDSERISQNVLKLVYHSHRSMASVAEGLILGCAKHFGEDIKVEILSSNESGTEVHFKLTKF